PISYPDDPGTSAADEALPGFGVHGSGCDDKEICRRSAPGTAGEDLGAAGRDAQQSDAGQLGHPVCADVAEAAVPAYEAGAAGGTADPRRRDRGAGAEGGRQGSYVGVPDVAVCQRRNEPEGDPPL